MLLPSNTRPRRFGAVALVAVAPLLYYLSVLAFTVNVPVGDDYSMLGFMCQFKSLTGMQDKLQLLFSFHNEHRIVLTRAIMLLCDQVTGALDFRTLNLIGNFALLPTLLVIGAMLRLRDDLLKWALLLLIALQPQPLKLMFYPMAVVQAYFGLLFSFLYLHYSLKESNSWYASFVFYLLTVLTTGSGIFLAALGVPLSLLQKRYGRAALQVFFGILVVLAYAPASSKLPYLIDHPVTVAKFALLLLGSIAQLPMLASPGLQIACSVALLAYFAYFVWDCLLRPSHRPVQENLAALSCQLYLLMVIALIAMGRTAGYEADLWGASLDGRYRIYSILFFALCSLDVAGRLSRRENGAAIYSRTMVTLALLFNLLWFAPALVDMRLTSLGRAEAMQQWLVSGDISVLPTWSTHPADAQSDIAAAVKAGIYRP